MKGSEGKGSTADYNANNHFVYRSLIVLWFIVATELLRGSFTATS